jgi:hypothetical protein
MLKNTIATTIARNPTTNVGLLLLPPDPVPGGVKAVGLGVGDGCGGLTWVAVAVLGGGGWVAVAVPGGGGWVAVAVPGGGGRVGVAVAVPGGGGRVGVGRSRSGRRWQSRGWSIRRLDDSNVK